MPNRNSYLIQTSLGKVEATPTEAKHIYVSFGSPYDSGEALIVRGVGIRGSAHFFLWDDGRWEIGNQYNNKGQPSVHWERSSSLHLTRVDSFRDGPSNKAHTVIADVLYAALGKWADSTEGKQALQVASLLDIEQRLLEAEKDEAKALEAYKAAQVKSQAIANEKIQYYLKEQA